MKVQDFEFWASIGFRHFRWRISASWVSGLVGLRFQGHTVSGFGVQDSGVGPITLGRGP